MSDNVDQFGVNEGFRPFVFDFDTFERMEDAGVFSDERSRVELIEGVICEMAPAAADHISVISQLQGQLFVALGQKDYGTLQVLSQGTLRIGQHSGPEPDVFVAGRNTGRKYYFAEDCVLVVEVAASSLQTDRILKSPMYARAGIPEFWLVDVEARQVRVQRGPRSDGQWDEQTTVSEGSLHPLFAPEISIPLADIFRHV